MCLFLFYLLTQFLYQGTRVILGSMNMGYVSDTARTRTRNRFHPKCAPIPLGHSDGQVDSIDCYWRYFISSLISRVKLTTTAACERLKVASRSSNSTNARSTTSKSSNTCNIFLHTSFVARCSIIFRKDSGNTSGKRIIKHSTIVCWTAIETCRP